MRDFNELKTKIFNQAKESGIEDVEIYYSQGRDLSIKVFEKEIDGYKLAEAEGLALRGKYNGEMGYSYTEKVDETSVDFLVENLIENAKNIDREDKEEIFEGAKEYKEVNNFNTSLEKIEEMEKINFVKNLEKASLEIDDRIKSIQDCVYGDGFSETIISNTKGLDIKDRSNLAYAYVALVAKEGKDIQSGFAYKVTNNFSELNYKDIAKEAVEEAISMLGAKSIKSGRYPIILRNNASADILQAFTSVFSAERVQKNLSLLKGKLKKKIASEKITLIDDPFMEKGYASSAFDSEGVPTKEKNIIEKGVLNTYLHNLKTALKDGVDSTGNASRSSYKSSIGISPTNMYIEPGEKKLDALISGVEEGLMITDVQGLHAGLNPISGDFSLSAQGFLIKKGEIKEPVNQITISGNFLQMLSNVEEIGKDLRFGLPSSSYIGSPSLKIKNLDVAGE
ncbi:MAG: TldD/PmbA family protein [Eubacteriales bacterium]